MSDEVALRPVREDDLPMLEELTLDLYGHLVDGNLWQAARIVGDISGTSEQLREAVGDESDQ